MLTEESLLHIFVVWRCVFQINAECILIVLYRQNKHYNVFSMLFICCPVQVFRCCLFQVLAIYLLMLDYLLLKSKCNSVVFSLVRNFYDSIICCLLIGYFRSHNCLNYLFAHQTNQFCVYKKLIVLKVNKLSSLVT